MNITRTIYGAAVQTALMLGSPHRLHEYSTFNEAIHNATIVPFQPTVGTRGMQIARPYDPTVDTRSLKMGYITIGNKGHQVVIEEDDGSSFPPEERSARASGLYGMIPFIIRPVENDLTNAQRAKYRLRKTLDIGGDLFVAYFARVFDMTEVPIEAIVTTIANGISTTATLVPTVADLKPTPPKITGSTQGNYARVVAVAPLAFTAEEVEELKNACNVLYGNERRAMISEIAFCTGVDKPIYRTYPNTGDQQFTEIPNSSVMEVVGLQAALVANLEPLTAGTLNGGTTITTDIGISEPLFGRAVDSSST